MQLVASCLEVCVLVEWVCGTCSCHLVDEGCCGLEVRHGRSCQAHFADRGGHGEHAGVLRLGSRERRIAQRRLLLGFLGRGKQGFVAVGLLLSGAVHKARFPRLVHAAVHAERHVIDI